MTLIIGCEHAGKVWIGADSGSSAADDSGETVVEPKIFQRGEWLIAGCGNWRALEIVRHRVAPPNVGAALNTSDLFSLTENMRRGLNDCDFQIGNDDDRQWAFLIGIRGALYWIDQSLHFERLASGRNADGCAASYALGVYDGATHVRSPEKRLRFALDRSAHRYAAAVRAPFTVLAV